MLTALHCKIVVARENDQRHQSISRYHVATGSEGGLGRESEIRLNRVSLLTVEQVDFPSSPAPLICETLPEARTLASRTERPLTGSTKTNTSPWLVAFQFPTSFLASSLQLGPSSPRLQTIAVPGFDGSVHSHSVSNEALPSACQRCSRDKQQVDSRWALYAKLRRL